MYRIDALLKEDQKLFHTNDLALLWNIKNKNTLYTTIKRYVRKGILIRIHKGFYATKPLKTINPIKIGISFLHTYAYLSTESVLTFHGIISQEQNYITLVCNLSKKFIIGKWPYLTRQLKDEFLYQTAGIIEKNGIKTATLERAVADLLYFNPKYYLDGKRLIDWKKVKKIQKEVGYL